MSRQEKLILFYVGLFCLTVVLVAFFWRSDQYYSSAYAPVVERSVRNRAIMEENRRNEGGGSGYTNYDSRQPAAAGFRERDIDKNKGDRFSTY